MFNVTVIVKQNRWTLTLTYSFYIQSNNEICYQYTLVSMYKVNDIIPIWYKIQYMSRPWFMDKELKNKYVQIFIWKGIRNSKTFVLILIYRYFTNIWNLSSLSFNFIWNLFDFIPRIFIFLHWWNRMNDSLHWHYFISTIISD